MAVIFFLSPLGFYSENCVNDRQQFPKIFVIKQVLNTGDQEIKDFYLIVNKSVNDSVSLFEKNEIICHAL